ncbi:ShlB/FhaC/HecB family hemolysin secretion/activation protein [Paraherbaspirillum soli]|uniref:ShlB/FhaC/HecB family hemolysin secretion/activation protein n=1 Tax=Paraherbaspirillum soli TaxID=631222 RepID=A0ABW0MFP2_9BURK
MKYFYRPLLLTLLAAAFSQPAVAQTARVEQDPAQRLLQEQRERDRQRELEQTPPAITVTQLPLPTLPADADIDTLADAEPTFKIDRIELVGNSVLPADQVQAITRPFLGKRLGSNRINLLLHRLTEVFVARGLITTRAYLGQQNLSSGSLTVTIIPGRIEAIQLNGKTLAATPAAPAAASELQSGGWLTDQGVLLAMPTAAGDVLNLTDLEQGVEQINRLRRNRAEMQIMPGATPGGSIIGLSNPPGDRFWFSAGFDNYGSSQTGLTRTSLGIEADNLLGLQEMVSLNYSGSLDTNALVLSAAVPFGYHTFSYTGSLSEYQNLVGDTALLYGNTSGHTFGWNYVLARSQAAKSALDVTLSWRKTEREINNSVFEPQRLTVLRIGFNRLRRFAFNQQQGSWTVDAGISRGLRALNASRDSAAITSDEAHSQFTKLDSSATLSLPLGKLGDTVWNWRGQLNAQWSRQALFGSEQIFAGGMSSVRGFQDGGISGDRGFYVRNDLIWGNAPELLGVHLEPYVFLDMGRTELIAEKHYRQLAGAGIGLRLQAQYGKQRLTSEVLLGHPIKQPDTLGSQRTVLLATLNYSY